MERSPIPAELKRRILVEAGHRCAIPTCRSTQVEIHHIVPYSETGKHEYDNLIALCPNCHTRADKVEIDRKSLYIYKRISQRLTDRFTRVEIQLLDWLRRGRPVTIDQGMLFLLSNLLDDQLIGRVDTGFLVQQGGLEQSMVIGLTLKGKSFLNEWNRAEEKLAY